MLSTHNSPPDRHHLTHHTFTTHLSHQQIQNKSSPFIPISTSFQQKLVRATFHQRWLANEPREAIQLRRHKFVAGLQYISRQHWTYQWSWLMVHSLDVSGLWRRRYARARARNPGNRSTRQKSSAIYRYFEPLSRLRIGLIGVDRRSADTHPLPDA